VLFSNSLASMKAMFRILVEELCDLKLQIKPGSLEVMSNFGLWDQEVLFWDAGGVQHKIWAKHSLNILGVTVDESGSDEAAVDYRISQAWVHFWAREKSFCDSIIPLKLRWQRIRDTVYKTLLHGSGGWLITEAVRKKLHGFEIRMLSQTLCRKPLADETPDEYHQRKREKVQDLQDLFHWIPLDKLAANCHISWWGHVARIPDPSPLRQLTKWRNISWETKNNLLRQGLKVVQSRLGHNWNSQSFRGLEACLDDYMGPLWETEALDRDRWSLLKAKVLVDRFGVVPGASLLLPSSNKQQDWTRGRSQMKCELRLLIIADNPLIVHQTTGVWQSKPRCDTSAYINFLKWNVHALHRFWKFRGAVKGEHLMQFRPRSQNCDALTLAAKVENSGEAVMHTCSVQVASHDLIVVTSSAYKGSSGSCACAAGLHVYRPNCGMILLGHWGIPMGNCTKVVAEFEGACLSIRLLMLWCIESNIVV
jgi:hypothetical protein